VEHAIILVLNEQKKAKISIWIGSFIHLIQNSYYSIYIYKIEKYINVLFVHEKYKIVL